MNEEAAKSPIDDLMLSFLNARSDAESEILLAQLILTHAQPLISNIVSYKLRASPGRWGAAFDGQEAQDLSNEVILRLIGALNQCKASPQQKPIASLRSYVATMAYNASDEYLRQKYPRRFSLKNRIRYILTHRSGLACWQAEARSVLCGAASASHLQKPATTAARLLQGGLDGFLHRRFADQALAQVNAADLVVAVLDYAGGPLEIDDLVTVMAELWGIRDAPPQAAAPQNAAAISSQQSFDPREALEGGFDHRARLLRVWEEILQLSLRQRAALLLNLRDEHGEAAIRLLPILRIASIKQIADVLEITDEELAAIWNELPMEDAAIGQRLGATRQQVANLRKCARERLARRLGKASGE